MSEEHDDKRDDDKRDIARRIAQDQLVIFNLLRELTLRVDRLSALADTVARIELALSRR